MRSGNRGGRRILLAFADTTRLTLLGRVPLAGARTFGDLAVLASNGRHVYATWDAGAAGTGGVTVIDAQNGQRAGGWAYSGVGRPHGIAYSTSTATAPEQHAAPLRSAGSRRYRGGASSAPKLTITCIDGGVLSGAGRFSRKR